MIDVCRLVSLIGDEGSSTELVCEAVITLGSFAHGVCMCVCTWRGVCIDISVMLMSGTPENIQALLSAKALPVLVKGEYQLLNLPTHTC